MYDRQISFIEYKDGKYLLRHEDGKVLGSYLVEELDNLMERIQKRTERLTEQDLERLGEEILLLTEEKPVLHIEDDLFTQHAFVDFDAIDFEEGIFREVKDEEDELDFEEPQEEILNEEEAPKNLKKVEDAVEVGKDPELKGMARFKEKIKAIYQETSKTNILLVAVGILLFTLLANLIIGGGKSKPIAYDKEMVEQIAKEDIEAEKFSQPLQQTADAVDAKQLVEETEELQTELSSLQLEGNSTKTKSNGENDIRAALLKVNQYEQQVVALTQEEIEGVHEFLETGKRRVVIRNMIKRNKDKKHTLVKGIESELSKLDGSFVGYRSALLERMNHLKESNQRLIDELYQPEQLSSTVQQVIEIDSANRERVVRELKIILTNQNIPFSDDGTGIQIK